MEPLSRPGVAGHMTAAGAAGTLPDGDERTQTLADAHTEGTAG